MREAELGEFLIPARETVRLNSETTYDTVGIYSHGKGLFERPPKLGRDISYSTYFRIHTGQFVYSRLFGWEGALAVVPDSLDGYFVSQEFPVFDVRTEIASPAYVSLLCQWPQVHRQLASQVTGMGGRRKRVHPAALLSLKVPLPPLSEQVRVADLVQSLDEASSRATSVAGAAHRARLALLDAFVTSALSDGAGVPTIGDVASLRLGFTKGIRSGPLVLLPYLRAANLTFGELRLADVDEIELEPREATKHRIRPDDVLLTEGGNPWDLGRGWIWEGQIRDCVHQNSVVRVTEFRDDVIPRYVAHLLESRLLRTYFEGQATRTSGVAHLGVAGAAGAPVPMVAIGAQTGLVVKLDAVREVEVAARRVREVGRRLRADLIADLLSGNHAIPASYDRFLEATA